MSISPHYTEFGYRRLMVGTVQRWGHGYYVLGPEIPVEERLRRLGVHRPQPQGPARVRLPGPDLPPSARYAAHIARLCAPGSSHETTASEDRDAPER